LELHKIKKNEDVKANEEFFKIINRMKKIELKSQKHQNHNEQDDFASEEENNEKTQEINEDFIENEKHPIANNIRLNKRRMKSLEHVGIEKKQKKTEFKHPTQFISAEPQLNKVFFFI